MTVPHINELLKNLESRAECGGIEVYDEQGHAVEWGFTKEDGIYESGFCASEAKVVRLNDRTVAALLEQLIDNNFLPWPEDDRIKLGVYVRIEMKPDGDVWLHESEVEHLFDLSRMKF